MVIASSLTLAGCSGDGKGTGMDGIRVYTYWV